MIFKILRYLWCCISPNGHVITGEKEDDLFNQMVTTCDRCNCLVKVWIDKDCKENEYWIQEIE